MPARTAAPSGGALSYEEWLLTQPPPAPPTNAIPGSTYVPPPPAPVPSELYGGASGVEPTGTNDPNYVVTYYPATGDPATANATDYFWTAHGRTPPSNYDTPFPASNLDNPTDEVFHPAPSEDVFKPGPPRTYVPGSTYIPPDPYPDPRLTYEERTAPPLNPTSVPGYAGSSLVSPGLGGWFPEGPLSRAGRPLAPRDPNRYTPVDPREPQDYQPGSSYVPEYVGMPPIGDPRRTFKPSQPGELYGGRGIPEYERRPDKTRIDTTYPASGAPETTRSTGYVSSLRGTSEVVANPEAVNRERVYVPGDPLARNPTAVPQDRAVTLAQMEAGRQARARAQRRLRGLFGSEGGLERVTRGGG